MSESLSNASLNLRFSATTVIPWFFAAFCVVVIISVPLCAAQVGAPTPVDKVAAVLLFPWALLGAIRAMRARRAYLALVAAYFGAAVLASVAHMAGRNYGLYPIEVPALGLVLDAKPFVYVFAFYELLARRTCEADTTLALVLRVTLAIALFNSIFVLRDLLVGGHSIWDIPLGTGAYGLPLANGLFNHKYSSACTTMLGALAAMSLLKDRFTGGCLIAFTWLSCILILHGAVKELMGVAAAGVLFVVLPSNKPSSRTLRTKVAFGLLMSAFALGGSTYISQTISRRYHDFGLEASVRVALHTAAYTIAMEHFPGGSGAGTFGSMPSRDMAYSPLYYRFGIFAMYRGGPGDGKFLMDAWWPHIMAETGFIGCIFYLSALACGVRALARAQRMKRTSGSFFLLAVALALVMNSLAAPTFTMDLLQPMVGLTWGASMLTNEKRIARGEELRGQSLRRMATIGRQLGRQWASSGHGVHLPFGLPAHGEVSSDQE